MKYPRNGMMKGMESMPVESAIRLMSRNPQPPIGVIISSDEALLVRPPRLRSDRENIVGNMMASKT